MSRRITCALIVAGVVGAGVVRAEIIDRILAVVDGAAITQSDVFAAVRLGLVPLAGAVDPLAAAVDRLVERRLTLMEVDRYAPPEPSGTVVEKRLAELRAAVPSQADFEKILAESGLTFDQLRRHVRDDLRIDTYLQTRFAATFQPSEDEIVQFYRDHPAQFSSGGAVRTFADVHDAARAALLTHRRATAIRDWIAGLRRRADVNVLLNVPVR